MIISDVTNPEGFSRVSTTTCTVPTTFTLLAALQSKSLLANYHFCRHADPYWLSTISELLLLPIELSEVPSDARGFVLRVVEAFRAGRPLDVIEELRVNPLANPKSPHMSAPLAALVARVYAQQEDYGRAALLLQRAHALRPSDGRVA